MPLLPWAAQRQDRRPARPSLTRPAGSPTMAPWTA